MLLFQLNDHVLVNVVLTAWIWVLHHPRERGNNKTKTKNNSNNQQNKNQTQPQSQHQQKPQHENKNKQPCYRQSWWSQKRWRSQFQFRNWRRGDRSENTPTNFHWSSTLLPLSHHQGHQPHRSPLPSHPTSEKSIIFPSTGGEGWTHIHAVGMDTRTA